ncbi:DUF3168 domain-containing protein [Acidaminobacter hydrogenoformans]|uniref:DUF3168 domain-containing protein n=1 Tax=Acidaminobacter hydrogenoformans DSM 2784 TaxID=1120920 RepID=A0A1G5S1X2_9FIRM|nr:DUF3168 domain-containing protein [Acidaminobacter hydrogenoformans]SCZ80395.1 Protein of unknown function [Acidaminobacter hydrogenoformans DSM 2784]
MTIEDAIWHRLNSEIPSLNGRIYPVTIDQGAPLPAIAYKRISTRRDPTLKSQGQYYTTFQFDILAANYTEMRELRDTIRLVFEDSTGEYMSGAPYIQSIDILNEMDGFDTGTQISTGLIEIEYFYTL